MDLQNPNFLFHLLWLLPVVVLLHWRASRLRKKRLRQFVAERNAVTDASRVKRRWRTGFAATALVMAVVAGARPQWGTELVQRPVQARDVMVVLDCSRSMLARDVAPSRLRHAKLLVRKLVSQSPGDRFGLVAFAGSSFLECPLTQDRSGFLLFLDDVSTETIPVGGTNIEDALVTALEGFEAAEGRHRAVLLITDGDELTGNVGKQAAACTEAGVTLMAVGLGDPELGSFLQLDDSSFVLDETGERVRSRLNEEALKNLAEGTGGFYVRSTPVYDGLDQLRTRIEALIPEGRTEQTVSRPMERYQGPLILAVVLLMLRLGTSERRSVAALLIAGCMVTATGRGQEPEIVPELETPAAVLAAPNVLERAYAWYNEGVRLVDADQSAAAVKAFDEAVSLAGDDARLMAAVCQNMGTLDHEIGRAEMLKSAMAGIKEPPAKLRDAATYYRQSLQSGGGADVAGGNLEQALLDLQRYKEMLKAFEKLKKEREQARKMVQQAVEAQEKANQTEGGKGKEAQNRAREKSEAAAQKVKALVNRLKKVGAADVAEMLAQQVGQNLADAQQAQKKALAAKAPRERGQRQQDAIEALQRALAVLGPDENTDSTGNGEGEGDNAGNDHPDVASDSGQDGGDPGDDSGGNGGSQAADDGANGDASKGDNGSVASQEDANGGTGKDGEGLDKEQALRILEANQRRERDLKRLLKERMKQSVAAGQVERDW